MEKIVNNGIVCFLDILGYKSLIINNTIEECAKIIKEILKDLPKEVLDEIMKETKEKISAETVKLIEKIISPTNCTVIMISDSILVLFDLENELCFEDNFGVALAYIRKLFTKSFEVGLPMRGCIDIGSYYYNDNLFAGKSIADTYAECSRLDFSGIVLTDTVFKKVENSISGKKRIFDNVLIKCNVPLNDNSENEKYLLKWYSKKNYENINDIKQFIFNSFLKHNKGINSSVMKKIDNTENILRIFINHDEIKMGETDNL
jgi:hypothetical protein